MRVFNLYFRIIRSKLASMMIYLGVFLILATVLTMVMPEETTVSFEETKNRIAIINEDEQAVFAEGLYNYLSKSAVVTSIKTDKQSMQDALFFREVVYILRIPKGYSEGFLSGDANMMLQKSAVPDSASEAQIDFLVSRYLRLANIYTAALPDISQEKLVSGIDNALEKQAAVSLLEGSAGINRSHLSYYFTYFSYSVMIIMIIGITSGMMVLGEKSIKMRNAASPLKILSANMQLALGNLVFALVVWAAMSAFGFLLYHDTAHSSTFVYFALNALLYTLVCLSLGFLLGYMIKSINVQSAVANVLSLGLSFLAGAFVPQEFLGETMRQIASFTPTYWYINAINKLGTARGIQDASLINDFMIQLGFAVAFLALALAVARHKRTANS